MSVTTLQVAPTKGVSSVTIMSTHSNTTHSSSGSGGSIVSETKPPCPWGGVRFLPSGDCLPASFNLALIKKLPMFPPPAGALQLYTQSLGQTPYHNQFRLDFDLSDPYNHSISNEYNPLTDPHLVLYLHKPRIHKRLLELGHISHDDKVLCSRKQYSQYARWLQHLGRQQFQRQAELERKRTARQLKASKHPDNGLKVAVIHAEVTAEERVTKRSPSHESQSTEGSNEGSKEESSTASPSMSLKENVDHNWSRVSEVGDDDDDDDDDVEGSGQVKAAQDRMVTGGGRGGGGEERKRSGRDNQGTVSTSQPGQVWSTRISDSEGKDSTLGQELERQMELVKEEEQREKQVEEKRDKARLKRAAQDIYTKATMEHMKRQKRELDNYQKDWHKYLDYISEAEHRRHENCAKQFVEGWTQPPKYSRQFEERQPADTVAEDSHTRSARYQRQLQDEINRRWQTQANRLKEQKDKGRKKLRELQTTYTRNLIKAFGAYSSTAQDDFAQATTSKAMEPLSGAAGSKIVPASQETPRKGSKFVSPSSGLLMPGTPHVRSSMTPSKAPDAKLQRKVSKWTYKQTSAAQIATMLLRTTMGQQGANTYPVKTRFLGQDEAPPHPADEVKIILPYELVMQRMPDPATDADEDVKSLMDEMKSPVFENRAQSCDKLSSDERVAMEELIKGLLKDMADGRMDREELVKLTTTCAALTEFNLMDEATSTTSLGEALRSGQPSDTTVASSVSRRTPGMQGEEEESYGSLITSVVEDALKTEEGDYYGDLVECTMKSTMGQMSRELRDGTLSRENVREVGSATASLILGEVRSEASLLGGDLVVPTLERAVQEKETLEEQLLNQAMTNLLSAYDQVVRRADKSVCCTVKDFVVHLLQRTREGLTQGRPGVDQFLSRMERCCQKSILYSDMDLPCKHELIEVLSVAIGKLEAISELCPVLCELVKILLDQGQALLMTQPDFAKDSLPRLDSLMLATVGSSPRGLEVLLEVADAVADGLHSEMLKDPGFRLTLCLSLAPSILLLLLTCWTEMTDAVPKETVAMQTSLTRGEEEPVAMVVEEQQATPNNAGLGVLGEDVILVAFHRLLTDSERYCLSPGTLTQLALHLAQALPVVPPGVEGLQWGAGFTPPRTPPRVQGGGGAGVVVDPGRQMPVPASTPCTTQSCHERRVSLSTCLPPVVISKKISSITQHVKEGRGTTDRGPVADYEDNKRLMACVLQVYIQQDLQDPAYCSSPGAPPDEAASSSQDPPGNKQCRYHTANLVAQVTRRVLEEVLVQVREGMSEGGSKSVHLVRDVLQIMSDCALTDIHDTMQQLQAATGTATPTPTCPTSTPTPQPINDPQLRNVVRATVNPEDEQTGVVQFLLSLLAAVESKGTVSRRSIVLNEDLKTDALLLRMELENMAREVCLLMSDMAAPIPQSLPGGGSEVDKMTRFLVSLLQECQEALQRQLIPPQIMYRFLCSVTPALASQPLLRDSIEGQAEQLDGLIQELQSQELQSPVFIKLVANLSKMSIENPNEEQVAEGMAAIAHVLSSVDACVLKQFVQSTLYSLLATLRERDVSTPGFSIDIASGEIEPMSEAMTMSTMIERTGSDEGQSVLVAKELEEPDPEVSTRTTTSNLDVSCDQMDQVDLPLMGSTSGESVEAEVDTTSKKEISHEASIIIHMALQSMVERLGVAAAPKTPQQSPVENQAFVTDMEVKEVVSSLQNVATTRDGESSDQFSGLDPSIAAYAQDLLHDVAQHMDKEDSEGECEGGIEVMDTKSIASLILCKTFKSIETGLSTGKLTFLALQAPEQKGKSLDSTPVPDPSVLDMPSLSVCVTNTLCAVRSELDLLEMTAGVSEGEPGSDKRAGHREDSSKTLKKALQIVDFLIKRLQSDTDKSKVQFLWSPEQKLSVVTLERRNTLVLSDKINWTAPPADLAEPILQVFRRVLKDMHNQNQFFNPDAKERETAADLAAVEADALFTLPCMPFLLDQFILTHLQNITTQLLRLAQGQEVDMESITKEAVLVTCTLNGDLKEMIDKEKRASDQADVVNKKMVVLSTLDDCVTKLLCEICTNCSQNIQSIVEGYQKTQTVLKLKRKTPAQRKSKVNQKAMVRSMNQVKTDLASLMGSMSRLKKGLKLQRGGSDDDEEDDESSEELEGKDVVLHAINQIMSCVKKDHVADYILQELYGIFLEGYPGVHCQADSLKVKLMVELESLVKAVQNRNIPRNMLTLIASEINSLEKRHVEDPRRFAQHIRRVSLSLTGISPEYLKMAVSDILAGYRRCSDPISDATTFRRNTIDFEGTLDKDLRGRFYTRRASGVPITRSSIDARTRSKMSLTVDEDTDNRELGEETVYSTLVTLQASPTLFQEEDIIQEQSETTSTLDHFPSFQQRLSSTGNFTTDGAELHPMTEEEEEEHHVDSPAEMDRQVRDSSKEEGSDRASEQGQGVAMESDIKGMSEKEPQTASEQENDQARKASSVLGDDASAPCGEKTSSAKEDIPSALYEQTENASKASSIKRDDTPTSQERPSDEVENRTVNCNASEESANTEGCPSERHASVEESVRSSLMSRTDCEAAREHSETMTGPELQSGGKERTTPLTDGSEGIRSEESLDSADGDWNRSAIRMVRDVVCRVDEVRKTNTSTAHWSQLPFSDREQCSQQPNKQHALIQQFIRNQGIPVQQNETRLTATQLTNNETHQPEEHSMNMQPKCRQSSVHQSARKLLMLFQNQKHLVASHNADRPKATEPKADESLEKCKSWAKGSSDESATSQRSHHSTNFPVSCTTDEKSGVSVESAFRESQHLHKISITRNSDQAKTGVINENREKSSKAFQGHVQGGNSSDFDMSKTSSKLAPGTKRKLLSGKCKSTPKLASPGRDMDPEESCRTVRKNTRHGSQWHPYLDKQYHSHALTSQERRAQEKAFSVGFSIYSKKNNLPQNQKQNKNVSHLETECMQNNHCEETQSFAQASLSVSVFPSAYIRNKSLQRPPANGPLFSKDLSSAQQSSTVVDSLRRKTSQRNPNVLNRASTVSKPLSSDQCRSGSAETGMTRRQSFSQKSPSVPERWTPAERVRTQCKSKNIQALSVKGPTRPSNVRGNCDVSESRDVQCSVAFPFIPAPPSKKNLKAEDAVKVEWPALPGMASNASHCKERISSERQMARVLGTDTISQSVNEVPPSPPALPRIAVGDLKAKLQYVIGGLRAGHPAVMDDHKHGHRRAADKHKTRSLYKKHSMTKSKLSDQQVGCCNLPQADQQYRGNLTKQSETAPNPCMNNKDVTRHGHRAIVPHLHQTTSQARVPHPPDKPITNPNLLVNGTELLRACQHQTPLKSVKDGAGRLPGAAFTPRVHGVPPSRSRLPPAGSSSAFRNGQGGIQHVPQRHNGNTPVRGQLRRAVKPIKPPLKI